MPDRHLPAVTPLTARSVAISALLGYHPPALPVRELVKVGGLFGIAERTTRVALTRMAADGDVVVEGGVYRLTERDPAQRLPQAADAYERGISLGATSKAYGLPGLRVGWAACRDRALVERLGVVRQYLSTCSAGPSEVLASVALKAAPVILGRNRTIRDANLQRLTGFLARHEDLFDCRAPDGGMVCYPRYLGDEGVDGFVARMAAAGVLLLPSSVFRSELMALPEGRFRIGFGRSSFAVGLDAMERALHR